MKNFFKKLAFVLALAMVVTAIAPAAQASAATEPAFKYTSKKLYIGGDKTGTYGDTYRFTFTNAKGYTATWKSSKPSVATVDAKTGEIQAVAVGTATIKATLKNKAGNVVETTAKVYVKQNAEKVGFGTTASVKDMAIGDTGKVNVYRQVGTTKVWKQSDKTVVTDVIKWTSSKPEVATVDKWGKVTAVGAGEAVITATATQSEGSTAVASKSYKVTVKAGLTDVKQTGRNAVELTFAGDLSAVATKENVKVYSMVGTTPVVVVVKDVKFDATDKTKATLTTYVDLAKDTEYVVEYADTKASFKGADLSADAVASIAIKTTTVEPSKTTALEFQAFDKNGIEITSNEITGRITTELATATVDAVLTGNNITIFTKDKTATVKAVYHTYKYDDNYKEITIDAVGTVVAQPDVTTVTDVNAYTLYKVADNNPDYTNAKKTISISDKDGVYGIAVQTKDSKGNTKTNVGTNADTNFKFYTSDQNTLIVNETSGALYPVKEGSAQVIVKYNDVNIAACTVVISGKRVVADVTAKFNRTNLTAGSTVADKITLTVETKDQYGDKINSTATITQITGESKVAFAAPTSNSGNKTTFEFNGVDFVKGSYQYKVTVGDPQVVRYVYFNVDNAKDTITSYQFLNNGKSVDTTLKYNDETDVEEFKMALEGFGSNGFKIADVDFNETKQDAYDEIGLTATATGSANYVVITGPDGKAADSKFFEYSANEITVKPVVVSSDAITLEKLAKGDYTVNVYELVKTATNTAIDACVSKPLAVAKFTITDAQAAVSVSQLKTAIDNSFTYGDLLTALKSEGDNKIIEVKIGTELVNSDIASYTYTGTGKNYYVTELVLNVPATVDGIAGTTHLVQKVTVTLPFNFAN